jgi:hypothetical protein
MDRRTGSDRSSASLADANHRAVDLLVEIRTVLGALLR